MKACRSIIPILVILLAATLVCSALAGCANDEDETPQMSPLIQESQVNQVDDDNTPPQISTPIHESLTGRIAFSSQGEIHVINADGSDLHSLNVRGSDPHRGRQK